MTALAAVPDTATSSWHFPRRAKDGGGWAEMFEDQQKARIACANRMERAGVDPLPYQATISAMENAEHYLKLGMGRCYRRVVDPSIRSWQQDTKGVGEHLLARLLGVIGHPRHTTRHHWEGDGKDRHLVDDGPMERRVSDLWSYCGHGDATRKRQHGMDKDDAMALESWRAKFLTHLIAESVLKAQGGSKRETIGPDAALYYARRAHTADREGWTDGHSGNDALRILGKELLLQLWLACDTREEE